MIRSQPTDRRSTVGTKSDDEVGVRNVVTAPLQFFERDYSSSSEHLPNLVAWGDGEEAFRGDPTLKSFKNSLNSVLKSDLRCLNRKEVGHWN